MWVGFIMNGILFLSVPAVSAISAISVISAISAITLLFAGHHAAVCSASVQHSTDIIHESLARGHPIIPTTAS